MKKAILALAVTALALTSCHKGVDKVFTGGLGSAINANGYQLPETSIESINTADLEISQKYVTYTIDISTPEGQTKLNGLNEKEAAQLALTEASMVHQCSMLINPKFTFKKAGKSILRVTVFGQPAYYKNIKQKPIVQSQYVEDDEEEVEVKTVTTTTTTKKPATSESKKKSRRK